MTSPANLTRAELYAGYRRAAIRHRARIDAITLPEGYRLAAVLMPVIEQDNQLQVLLTQRADHLRHHAGQISFPGGRVEVDDASPLSAALREAEEEICLRPSQVDVLGPLPARSTAVSSFHILPYLGFVGRYTPGDFHRGEVSAVFSVPLQHVLDPAQHIRREVEWQGAKRHYHEIFYQQHRIWGATADMLVTLSGWLHPQS